MEALAAAETLLVGFPDSAVSRAFYAAYHGVTAVFALQGRTFSKHAAVRSALHRELVHSGQWPEDLGRAYDLLMELRRSADYGAVAPRGDATPEDAIEAARRIVRFVRRTYPQLSEEHA